MKSVTQFFHGGLFVAALAFAGVASAQDAPSPAPAGADNAEVMSNDDLNALSGGTGVTVEVITQGTLNAVNSGNTVSGDVVSSGQVNVGADAFSGYSGIGNFVINTGHNNNLQSNMSVSVVITPPAPAPGP
ncbi:MAG: hypothetical protein WAU68_03775 [Vitreimonas sp.]